MKKYLIVILALGTVTAFAQSSYVEVTNPNTGNSTCVKNGTQQVTCKSCGLSSTSGSSSSKVCKSSKPVLKSSN